MVGGLLLVAIGIAARPVGREIDPAAALALDHPWVARHARAATVRLFDVEVVGSRSIPPEGLPVRERLDPWGRPWVREVLPAGRRRVYSAGPDGRDQAGEGDDVVILAPAPLASWAWGTGPPASVAAGLLALALAGLLRVARVARGQLLLRALVVVWALLLAAWSWFFARELPADLAPDALLVPVAVSVSATLTTSGWAVAAVLLRHATREGASAAPAPSVTAGLAARTLAAVLIASVLAALAPTTSGNPDSRADAAPVSSGVDPLLARFPADGPPPCPSRPEIVGLGAVGLEAHRVLARSLRSVPDPLVLIVAASTGGRTELVDSIERDVGAHASLLLQAPADLLMAVFGCRRVAAWTAALLARRDPLPGMPQVRFGPSSPWTGRLCDHAAQRLLRLLEPWRSRDELDAAALAQGAPSYAEGLDAWWSASGTQLLAELPGEEPHLLLWWTDAPTTIRLDGEELEPGWFTPLLERHTDERHAFALVGPLLEGVHRVSLGEGPPIDVVARRDALAVIAGRGARLEVETDASAHWRRVRATLRDEAARR